MNYEADFSYNLTAEEEASLVARFAPTGPMGSQRVDIEGELYSEGIPLVRFDSCRKIAQKLNIAGKPDPKKAHPYYARRQYTGDMFDYFSRQEVQNFSEGYASWLEVNFDYEGKSATEAHNSVAFGSAIVLGAISEEAGSGFLDALNTIDSDEIEQVLSTVLHERGEIVYSLVTKNKANGIDAYQVHLSKLLNRVEQFSDGDFDIEHIRIGAVSTYEALKQVWDQIEASKNSSKINSDNNLFSNDANSQALNPGQEHSVGIDPYEESFE